MADVVIVGAGPMGLAAAIALAKYGTVVILEKYEKYKRHHTLKMEHQKLEALMKAIGKENDPTLLQLLQQLKGDPFIRTKALQAILKSIAEEAGVQIKQEEIGKKTIHAQILEQYPEVKLIIGADGTHSIVSESLFPVNNQVKNELDYVLQFRYEIIGEAKAESRKTVDFYQAMARYGLIAHENMGHLTKAERLLPCSYRYRKKHLNYLNLLNPKVLLIFLIPMTQRGSLLKSKPF